jgi:hypothetical protein
VLTVVAIGLLTLSAARAVHWSLHRIDAIGRPAAFPAVTVAATMLAAAGCLVPVVRHAQLERILSGAAGRIVGSPVRVHCQTVGGSMVDLSGDLGHVRFGPDGVPEHEAVVKREQCQDIRRWRAGDRGAPTREQAIAVHVLTHESMHMSGITSEAATECAAVQRDAAMVWALGGTPSQAVTLAGRYWREVYPMLADGYRSADCRPGGAMDERIFDPPWAQ